MLTMADVLMISATMAALIITIMISNLLFRAVDILDEISKGINKNTEMLENINENKNNEMLEVYKDAMDRVMSKSIGQYEAVKQMRETGEPLDQGGRATSKSENLKKQIEKTRQLYEREDI